jgi:nitrate/nitrite transport system ATP-binding protein
MAILELNDVAKGYGEGAARSEVLAGIDLAIDEGEVVAIVGFSGSGKTTLISTIAGLIQPDAGEVRFKGEKVTGAGHDRGVVFQSYSLMPWLSVRDNVALAVDAVFARETRAEKDARIGRYVEMVGLAHAVDRKPAELSDGMRQRVAVARALAMSPDILLLDEPLSALDALTRAKLQDEIEAIWSKEKKTVVLITNDVDEAILLADRIIPLTPGPKATLGPEFKVDLPRPRDRTAMNHDERFKRLRNEVTRYLMEVGIENRADDADGPALPDVTPILPSGLRRALQAKVPHREERYLEFAKLKKIYPTPRARSPWSRIST